eukprot:gb/GFBE01049196.1/.p1 GENE.gb/GFBE01049196.1/~~gb/GFBE01049196.1/.p1  ORF type:complete len:838 (+),score=163.56 gb/GFBE01049196.1/:1-2514(+)
MEHTGKHHGRNGKGHGKSRARAGQSGKRSSFPWINQQIISASATGDLQHLMSTIMNHLQQMNLVNLSTALHRLAKLASTDSYLQADLRNDERLEVLLHTISIAFTTLEAAEVQPQSISNVVWSLATMRYVHRPLLQVLTELSVSNIDLFKPFELSTTLWALAKLGTVDQISAVLKPVFQQAAAPHILSRAHDFGFRCLATTAWAFATARQRHARLFRVVAAQMLPMVHSANCQEMANTAWAFGTAGFHDDELFKALAEKAMMRPRDFKPQELSNMLWGFATNGFFHEGFFSQASVVAQKMDLQAQHLANILWAFARVRPRHPLTHGTILALLPLCTAQLRTFKPQEVSSTALAVGKAMGITDNNGELPAAVGRHMMLQEAQHLPPEVLDFFNCCTTWVASRLPEFSAQSLANTVSAFVMVPVAGSAALFELVGREVLSRINELEATALLHLLKAFASMPISCSGKVAPSLAMKLANCLRELRPQELQTVARICEDNAAIDAAWPVGAAVRRMVPADSGMKPASDLNADEIRQKLLDMAAVEVPNHDASAALLAQLKGGPVSKPPRRPLDPLSEALLIPPAKVHQELAPIWPAPPADPPCSMEPGADDIGAKEKTRMRKGISNAKVKKPDKASPQQPGEAFTQQLPLCTINEQGLMKSLAANQQVMDPDAPPFRPSQGLAVSPLPASVPIPPFAATAPVLAELGLQVQALAADHSMMMLDTRAVPPWTHGNVGELMPVQDDPFTDYQNSRRWRERDRAPEQLKWSIKNSFLHLEPDESEEDDGDCNSSQRSSSVPTSSSQRLAWQERGRTMPSPEALQQLAGLPLQPTPSVQPVPVQV